MKNIDVIKYIKSDLWRYAGNTKFSAFLKHFLINEAFRYNFYFRASKSNTLIFRFIAKFILRHLSLKYGVHIPWGTNIGYGFYISHLTGIIVNGSSTIGNNCNISQFTTIGSNNGLAAEIGDNVYIGPSVCIVEDVKIGSNSTIGAGAVVVKDVPQDSTVAGCPAKVISMKSPGRFILNRYHINHN